MLFLFIDSTVCEDGILHLPKLEAFAEKKNTCDSKKNIEEPREKNVGNQEFIFITQCFLSFKYGSRDLKHFHFVVCICFQFQSLPDDKILDLSKLKAFADDKISMIEKLKFVLGRVENIVGKEENAGYQHFLLFPLCFQNASIAFFDDEINMIETLYLF